MAALFILILVGYGAAKLRIIDGRFSQQLSVFVINISSPCLIVSSVMGDISPDKDLILPVLAIGCVTYAFFVAVAMLLSRIITKNKDMQGIYGFMLTFGNVGFIGYPIVASIFGKYAIFYASLLNIPFTLLAFSLGKKMIQGGPGGLKLDWKILVSPAMIACYLSTLIVVFDIKGLPNIVSTPITLLGNITVPAALLIIGTSMAQMDLRRIFSGKLVWGISVLRLLVLPISRHQHRPRGHACGHIRGDVLPPVRQGRDRHGPGNPHLHPPLDTQHPAHHADTLISAMILLV